MSNRSGSLCARLRRALAALTGAEHGASPSSTPAGTANISDNARIYGPTVGLNLGTIIYGRAPDEDERRRLVWYLEGLAAKLVALPLRGLDDHLHRGQRLELPGVYVALATESRVEVARGRPAELRHYFNQDNPRHSLKPDYDPDQVLPEQALYRAAGGSDQTEIVLQRALLAVAAVQRHQHVVLRGDPGAGKSTFLRHLAWALARRALDPATAPALPGWEAQHPLLPILLPLRTLAGRLAREGVSDATVYAALRDELHAHCTHQIDDALSAALSRGAALLLFDGLDEVPLAGTPDVADRFTTLRAVQALVRRYARCPAILTCRTRAFDAAARAELGWPVETLAPFTLGQVRAFVPAWYCELVAKGQITPEQADRLTTTLLAAIQDATRPRLRTMAATPLLLTLMALVLFNKGELPRDRPQLYERILELLLGQWDQVRDGQSLGPAIGQPGWDSSYIRPLLDRLSYQAHAEATSADGRGRLAKSVVRDALCDFFETMHVSQPWETARRCLEYIEQRSGLLLPDGPDSFVFAHLTLQEHCAGRQITLNTDDPVTLVLEHRTDDRWREPIMLGLGLAAPLLLDRLLNDLIEREESGTVKPSARWYRDLILAAEIGADRDWTYLRTRPQVRVERFQRDLQVGLVELLSDHSRPLPVNERVRAGFLLGDLGDPRVPVTPAEWQRELERARAGDTSGYFCRVPAGTYLIGSADDDPDAEEEEQPQHQVEIAEPFLVARFPITNAQWEAWVQVGGEQSRRANDTDLNHPNQPVVAITWRMCNDFCAWLSDQLGITIRLPTEAEWEAAARGGDARRYPWGDEWCDDHAATKEDREARGWAWNVPVGCYPAGAAPGGALDMAGNVREWTADIWQSYPGAGKPFTEENRRVLRGGYYGGSRTYVRCGARNRVRPDFGIFSVEFGFRVVAAPPLAQMS